MEYKSAGLAEPSTTPFMQMQRGGVDSSCRYYPVCFTANKPSFSRTVGIPCRKPPSLYICMLSACKGICVVKRWRMRCRASQGPQPTTHAARVGSFRICVRCVLNFTQRVKDAPSPEQLFRYEMCAVVSETPLPQLRGIFVLLWFQPKSRHLPFEFARTV